MKVNMLLTAKNAKATTPLEEMTYPSIVSAMIFY
jgi:hypothetical protein